MDQETFAKHKPFAGEKKPSMLRRRVGHDYESRRIYLITMTVEGRRPLLGTLVGSADAPDGSPDAPRVEPSLLGEEVQRCWQSIPNYYPEVQPMALQLMPDHLHGILFVTHQMEQHLGMVLKGFKAGCNKAYRRLFPQVPLCSNTVAAKETSPKGTTPTGFLFSRNYNDHILGLQRVLPPGASVLRGMCRGSLPHPCPLAARKPAPAPHPPDVPCTQQHDHRDLQPLISATTPWLYI